MEWHNAESRQTSVAAVAVALSTPASISNANHDQIGAAYSARQKRQRGTCCIYTND